MLFGTCSYMDTFVGQSFIWKKVGSSRAASMFLLLVHTLIVEWLECGLNGLNGLNGLSG
ncbi:hypothetical protein [Paenibacillus alba]|uniref:Uncharacterized protein n=1 Tax=Paenibacillus alba TaxID=1197127 RepID=A0ABU6G7M8_9BACL|nr:hypothetical protein [Paenibacillus alba]MEC0229645.1 hypothetical protein [Paenibacillus alba]